LYVLGAGDFKDMADIFGMIMMDASQGQAAEHRIERDDGYVNDTNGRQYVAPVTEWQESERLAVPYAKAPVLDIGCGAGRVGEYLTAQGVDWTGIDISPGSIQACQKRRLMNAHLMSADDIKLRKRDFRTIILFGNNFGILGEKERVVKMLKQLHGMTAPDAVILAGSRDPKATEEEAHLKYHQWNESRGRPIGLVRLRIHYRDLVSDWFELLLSSPEEMNQLAEQAGWRLVRTFGERKYYVGLLEKKS
jgi:SAM-dependent methyltransferase